MKTIIYFFLIILLISGCSGHDYKEKIAYSHFLIYIFFIYMIGYFVFPKIINRLISDITFIRVFLKKYAKYIYLLVKYLGILILIPSFILFLFNASEQSKNGNVALYLSIFIILGLSFVIGSSSLKVWNDSFNSLQWDSKSEVDIRGRAIKRFASLMFGTVVCIYAGFKMLSS